MNVTANGMDGAGMNPRSLSPAPISRLPLAYPLQAALIALHKKLPGVLNI